ncbi:MULTISPECIES: hypothetical protein [Kribbella]|uniref:Uncharacterized protein n=1 Tax=Kribbella karoonensis TaxID=324851 RepID=A0ABN2DMX5_9ACTN
MAARDLAFGEGDRVRTWGRYVARPDGEWLDLARVHDLLIKPPGWKSDRSIRLIGVDAAAVPTDWTAHQAPGSISVVGRWGDESIEVDGQSPETPRWRPRTDRSIPPCPPPPDGWRRDAEIWELGPDADDLEASGTIVHKAIFRPSENQEVLVVAATDVDAVTRQLSRHLPDQLCVVQSRFTRAQLDGVRDVLLARWQEWRLETIGTGHSDAQGQPFATAEPFRVPAAMAEWADTLPEGLLQVSPTIVPA